MRYSTFLYTAFLICSVAWGQSQPSRTPTSGQSSPQMSMRDMSGHDMPNMQDTPADSEKDSADSAAPMMHSMEGHMDMGPHMKMTPLRPPKPGDEARAQQVVEAARNVAEKYQDYHVALADGFKIFLPNVPQ